MTVGKGEVRRLLPAAALLAGSLLFLQMRLLAGAPRAAYPPCPAREAGGEVVRLHVVAAGDAPADRIVKGRVRQAVAPLAVRLAASAGGPAEALDRLAAERGALRHAAARAAAEAGGRDRVGVEVGWHRFPGGSLAAGCYPSVVVTIGPGRGSNWWCVLYPPVCLPLAAASPGPGGAASGSGGPPAFAAGGAGRNGPLPLRWYLTELAARLAGRRAPPLAAAKVQSPGSAAPTGSHMLVR